MGKWWRFWDTQSGMVGGIIAGALFAVALVPFAVLIFWWAKLWIDLLP